MRPYTVSEILQSAAVATGIGTVLDVTGMSVVAVQVTIAGSATITFEAALGSGTMTAIPATNLATGATATTATATGIYLVNCAALTRFQARISTWASGAVTAIALASSEAGGAVAGALGSAGTVITGPLGRKADALSVSVALSTEDVALFPAALVGGRLDVNVGAGGVLEVTGSAGSLNADAIASTDVSAYRWLSVQILGTWSGTITFQASNDNTNWVSTSLAGSASAGSGPVTSTTANGLFHGPVIGKYFRVRATSYSSGTATGTLEASVVPGALQSIGAIVAANGATAAGAADAGSPVKTGGKYNATPPTLTDGWRGDTQLDVSGSTRVAAQAAISGGATPYTNLDLGVTGQVVKASPGQLYAWYISNNAAAARFIKIYDKATAPTQADTPVMTLQLPAGAAANVALPTGLLFAAGISVRATTGVAVSDTGAPTTNDCVINLAYK